MDASGVRDEFLAETGDIDVDRAVQDPDVPGPYRIDQFLAAEYLPDIGEQQLEDLKFDAGQPRLLGAPMTL